MTRPALPPFPDMLGATPAAEWTPEIDEPVEIFVEHANLRYADAGDANRWRGWFAARWTDHNGGGWVWRGMIGTVTHVRPIVPEDEPPRYREAA